MARDPLCLVLTPDPYETFIAPCDTFTVSCNHLDPDNAFKTSYSEVTGTLHVSVIKSKLMNDEVAGTEVVRRHLRSRRRGSSSSVSCAPPTHTIHLYTFTV